MELLHTFKARGDHGDESAVHALVDTIRVGAPGDPRATMQGRKTLKTADGANLNHVSKGVYQVAGTGVTLRSDDSAAP